MADPDYVAALEGFQQQPFDVVRITIEGTSGNNVYYFCSRESRPIIHRRLGIDMLPLLRRISGVSTRIIPAQAVTDRGVRSMQFHDEEQPETWSNKSPNKGGTWWTRFRRAYREQYYGALVEHLGCYDTPAFTSISKAELKFRGRITGIDFENDGTVQVKVRDELDLKKISVPPTIGDANVLAVAIAGAGDYFFTPTDRLEFSFTELQWPSRDLPPPVALIESERIAFQRNVSTVSVLACQQWVAYSEAVQNAAWAKSNASAVDAAEIGPWGPTNGTRIDWTNPAVSGYVQQATSLLALAVGGYCGAVWLKRTPGAPAGAQVVLSIRETGGQILQTTITLPDYWTRYEIGGTWSAPPLGSVVTFRIAQVGTGTWSCLMAQPQVIYGSVQRMEYCRATTNVGLATGRGFHGTTAVAHAQGVALKELACYRDLTSASDSAAVGLHPIVIARDLINRGQIPLASVDEAAFGREFDFQPGSKFRRIISQPRSNNELLTEVREQGLFDTWASEKGLVTIRFSYRPPLPGVTAPLLTEETEIIEDTLEVSDGKDDRMTRVYVHWDLKTIGGEPAPGDKPEDFSKAQVSIDVAAEGSGLRAIQAKRIYSRWIYDGGTALALASRLVRRFRLGPSTISARITVQKDLDVLVGDVVEISGRYFYVRNPADATEIIPATILAQVTEKKAGERGGDIDMSALEGPFGNGRFIGPSGMADYTSQSAYVQATYGSICVTGTLAFTNGDPCHRIF